MIEPAGIELPPAASYASYAADEIRRPLTLRRLSLIYVGHITRGYATAITPHYADNMPVLPHYAERYYADC